MFKILSVLLAMTVASAAVAQEAPGVFRVDLPPGLVVMERVGTGAPVVPQVTIGDRHWREGVPILVPVHVSGAEASSEVSVSGLPAGVRYDKIQRSIVGTAVAGTAPYRIPFQVHVSLSSGPSTHPFDLFVHPSTRIEWGDAHAMTEFVAAIPAPSTLVNGYGAVAWSLDSGALPPGTSVDASTGSIVGTPTAYGSFGPIVVRAEDSLGPTLSSAAMVEVLPGTVQASLSSEVNAAVADSFSGEDWTSAREKVLLVPSDAIVGSVSPSLPAMLIDDALGGSLRIVVHGQVLGAGGIGDGGAGGDAIASASDRVVVENHGQIWSGGGAGGRGGKGGPGYWDSTVDGPYYIRASTSTLWEQANDGTFNIYFNGPQGQGVSAANPSQIRIGNFVYIKGIDMNDPYGNFRGFRISRLYRTDTMGGTPAISGSGRGHLQPAGAASSATPGGVGAGASGVSGGGGDWGQSGQAGTAGEAGAAGNGDAGSSGGLAGRVFVGPIQVVDMGGSVKGR